MPADPLAGPVTITQRAVLGDQIRRPTAWCEMAACGSRYEDPAALGEADIRARALAAGWQYDNVGRLLCPYCQWRRPRLQAAFPAAGQGNPPALQQTGHAQAGRIGAVRAALLARHRRLPGGQDLRPRWLRLLALLFCGRNGWNTPPLGPAVGAPSRLHSAAPPGPSHSPGHRPVATPPANDGADDYRRPWGQPAKPDTQAPLRRAGRHAARPEFRLPLLRHQPGPAPTRPALAAVLAGAGVTVGPGGTLSLFGRGGIWPAPCTRPGSAQPGALGARPEKPWAAA